MKKILILMVLILTSPALVACASYSTQALVVELSNASAVSTPLSAQEAELTIPPPTAVVPAEQPTNTAPLQSALGQMPAEVSHFTFTNWQQLKQHHYQPDLTSASDLDSRTRFMLRVLQGSQAPAALDRAFFRYQAQNWGWDSTDLLWEAEGQFDQMIASVHLLRFRPDYDFASLVTQLQRYQFQLSEQNGIPIYSISINNTPEWHFRSNLAHHNIAILADEGILIMSPLLESVQRVLAVRHGLVPSLSQQQSIQEAAPKLNGLAGVDIHLGPQACRQFSPYYQEKGGELGAAQIAEWPVQPYQLLASGHTFADGSQSDLLLVLYEDTASAQIDFDLRQQLLVKGQSPFRKTPYSQQFILEEAIQEENLLAYTLIPSPTLHTRPGWPQTISGWLQDGDALFAACQMETIAGANGIE